MNIIDISQNSAEWLEWRRNGIGASDVAIILGESEYCSRWRLWAEKTGRLKPDDLDRNPLVIAGKMNEDRLRDHVEYEIDDILLPICVEDETHSYLRASLDGFSSDDIPHEFKWPSEKVWIEVCLFKEHSKQYQLYKPQVEYQLIVTGAKHGFLVFGQEVNGLIDTVKFKIELTRKREDEIREAVKEFWELVVNDTEPDRDKDVDPYLPDDEISRNEWRALAIEAQSVCAQRRALKSQMDEVDKEFREIRSKACSQMGDYMNADLDGLKVTRYLTNGQVDYARLIKDKLPDLTEDEINAYRKNGRMDSRMDAKASESIHDDSSASINEVVAADCPPELRIVNDYF